MKTGSNTSPFTSTATSWIPHDFYATYFNNPALGPIPYNAATGHMKRASVWDFIEKISKETDLVGFTIAEYMPWSAMQMRELMKRTKIFG